MDVRSVLAHVPKVRIQVKYGTDIHHERLRGV